jgi:hypothetical protein
MNHSSLVIKQAMVMRRKPARTRTAIFRLLQTRSAWLLLLVLGVLVGNSGCGQPKEPATSQGAATNTPARPESVRTNSAVPEATPPVAEVPGRELPPDAKDPLLESLRAEPAIISVGVAAAGGREASRLADDLLAIAKEAGCDVRGVFQVTDNAPFKGVKLKIAPEKTPTKAVNALEAAFVKWNIDYIASKDSTQPPGSVYIFVGAKP